ncbi:MAG: amidohydrolase family protein, partial [Chloroflexota bacterium]
CMAAFRTAFEERFSVASNLRDMDAEGVDLALLLPTAGLYAPWAEHIGPDLAAALCRAYNNWLADQLRHGSDRLRGVALLPLQDVDLSAAEPRRAVRELHLSAGFLLPNPMLGRRIHHAYYDPLYREAEQLGVPLLVSQLPGLVLPQFGQGRYESFFALKALAEPFEGWLAAGSLVAQRCLERFPQLKVGFVGLGSGWLLFWLDRLDEHWGGPFGTDAPGVLPQIFRQQCFAACAPWERTVPDTLQECGPTSVVWSSHYPLPELASLFPNEVDGIARSSELSVDQRRAVLWDTAANLLHIH